MNDPVPQQEFVLRRLNETWQFAGRDVAGSIWLAILIPVLILGLIYVVVMYRRDCRSLAWPFAVLFGIFRALVYCTLAGVFLLPAWQTWETTQKRSRVVVLVDASPSMAERSDDIPPEDGAASKLSTRLEKVANFLAEEQLAFINRLAEKNPVYVYRFSARLDDEPAVFEKGGPRFDLNRWNRWLRFDLKLWLLNQLDKPSADALSRHVAFESDQP